MKKLTKYIPRKSISLTKRPRKTTEYSVLESYFIKVFDHEVKVEILSDGEKGYYVLHEPNLNENEKKLLRELMLRFYETLTEPKLPGNLRYHFLKEIKGLGFITPLTYDDNLEDIYISPHRVYVVHKKYGTLITNLSVNNESLREWCQSILSKLGIGISIKKQLRRFSYKNLRIDVTIGEQQPNYFVTIRVLPKVPPTPIDLIKLNTIDEWVFALLTLFILAKKTILIIGPPAAGKTVLMWSFLQTLPLCKIVIIQYVNEIYLPDIYPVEYLVPSRGLTTYDLIEEALRGKSPSYLVLAEIHGREGYSWAQVGRSKLGTMSTFHASDIKKAITSLTAPPISIPKDLLLSALDVVIRIKKYEFGRRRFRRVVDIFLVNGKNLLKVCSLMSLKHEEFLISPTTVFDHIVRVEDLPFECNDLDEVMYDLARLARYCLKRNINGTNFTRLLWKYYQNPRFARSLSVRLKKPKTLLPEIIKVR